MRGAFVFDRDGTLIFDKGYMFDPADVELVAKLAVFGYLVAQGIVNFAVIILRRKGLSVKGTFRAPLFPLIPLLGFIICIALIPSLDFIVLQLGSILAFIGLIIYLAYGKRCKRRYVEGQEVVTCQE